MAQEDGYISFHFITFNISVCSWSMMWTAKATTAAFQRFPKWNVHIVVIWNQSNASRVSQSSYRLPRYETMSSRKGEEVLSHLKMMIGFSQRQLWLEPTFSIAQHNATCVACRYAIEICFSCSIRICVYIYSILSIKCKSQHEWKMRYRLETLALISRLCTPMNLYFLATQTIDLVNRTKPITKYMWARHTRHGHTLSFTHSHNSNSTYRYWAILWTLADARTDFCATIAPCSHKI